MLQCLPLYCWVHLCIVLFTWVSLCLSVYYIVNLCIVCFNLCLPIHCNTVYIYSSMLCFCTASPTILQCMPLKFHSCFKCLFSYSSPYYNVHLFSAMFTVVLKLVVVYVNIPLFTSVCFYLYRNAMLCISEYISSLHCSPEHWNAPMYNDTVHLRRFSYCVSF